MRESKTLVQHIEALQRFRDELERLLKMMDEAEARALPRSSADPFDTDDIRRQRRHVGELSGGASIACAEAGVVVTHQNAPVAGGRVTTINPVSSWSNAVDGTGYIDTTHVKDSANQAIGVLEARRRTAEAQERSIAGRVARFIRFPIEVREVAGLQPKTTAGRTVFGIAAAIQAIFVAVVAGLILALLGVGN